MSSRRSAKQANRSTRTKERRLDVAVGTLDVLSVGHGHMKVTITPGDEAEQDKARRMIEDMLKRGFSIFVEMDDGSTRRVKKFNPDKLIYYVDPPEVLDESETAAESPKRTPKKKAYREVPVARSRATAVGRSAGG